jgi:hypothetical protein
MWRDVIAYAAAVGVVFLLGRRSAFEQVTRDRIYIPAEVAANIRLARIALGRGDIDTAYARLDAALDRLDLLVIKVPDANE